ncbi:type 1 glutamine amidotransferase domain-containing protein [Aliarcobacter cryaerophilus]|uniref:type 1 glutamine amidotransferase domain-containing protein n=1 Tax=Aliarcobacter cryaerophilus TaxID=28198 RepID=UPI000834C979|nr:type 1 glutamine amidotransferase domain-containing protein [Aliarcobacter cryaerophilus]
MKRAVIIAGKGFEDSEFTYPYYRLQEENIKVEIAVAGDKTVKGKMGQEAVPTIKCSDLKADNFDIVVIPGGHEGPDRVRQVKEVLEFIKEMDNQKKLIATICHGSWVTISAGIMRGKKATCYKGMKDDLINSGCKYLDEDVVIDGNFISSPHFRNNHQWMKALIEQI